MGEIIKKAKNIKGFGLLVVGLIAGLALVAIGSFSGDKNSEAAPGNTTDIFQEENLDECRKKLETELKNLIESMDGVGTATVIVTLEEGSCTVYAQDGTYSGGTLQSKKYVLADGDKPITVKIVCPKVRGVAVVCGGGSNPIIAQKVTSMICALLDLNYTQVFVSG